MEFEDDMFETDVAVNINFQGISERYYNYLNILILQSQDGGGPFQTPPVPLRGNCKNINDENEEILGYFRLSEVIKDTITIL